MESQTRTSAYSATRASYSASMSAEASIASSSMSMSASVFRRCMPDCGHWITQANKLRPQSKPVRPLHRVAFHLHSARTPLSGVPHHSLRLSMNLLSSDYSLDSHHSSPRFEFCQQLPPRDRNPGPFRVRGFSGGIGCMPRAALCQVNHLEAIRWTFVLIPHDEYSIAGLPDWAGTPSTISAVAVSELVCSGVSSDRTLGPL